MVLQNPFLLPLPYFWSQGKNGDQFLLFRVWRTHFLLSFKCSKSNNYEQHYFFPVYMERLKVLSFGNRTSQVSGDHCCLCTLLQLILEAARLSKFTLGGLFPSEETFHGLQDLQIQPFATYKSIAHSTRPRTLKYLKTTIRHAICQQATYKSKWLRNLTAVSKIDYIDNTLLGW